MQEWFIDVHVARNNARQTCYVDPRHIVPALIALYLALSAKSATLKSGIRFALCA